MNLLEVLHQLVLTFILLMVLGKISSTAARADDMDPEKLLDPRGVTVDNVSSATRSAGLRKLMEILTAVRSDQPRKGAFSAAAEKSIKFRLASLYPVLVAFGESDAPESPQREQTAGFADSQTASNKSSSHLVAPRLDGRHPSAAATELQKRPDIRVPSPEEPLPWKCDSRSEWQYLGRSTLPRYIQVIKCEQSDCYYGHFACKPVRITVKAIKMEDDLWEEISVPITVACECGRIY